MTGGFRVVAEQRFRCQIREGGFSFCFIHHGEEALATLAVEADIDLMLLDFNIPVMDGLTLLSPAFVKSRRRSRRSSSRPMAKPPNFQTPLVVRYPLLRPPVSNRRRNSRDCRAA